MKRLITEKLTSVKLPENLLEDFRIMTSTTSFTFKDLAERSMHMYLTDPDYRHQLHAHYSTYYTGSHIVEEIKNTLR